MMKAAINVVAISLATRARPVMLTGSLTENALHIFELTELPPGIAALRAKITALTTSLDPADSVTLYLEDPTGLLQGLGYPVRLDYRMPDNRPLLALALERYRALTAMSGIMYPGDSGGAFAISDSIVNVKVGDSGALTYEVDWAQLKDGSRALLLLIYGAMCQNPMQTAYLERFYGELAAMMTPAAPSTSFGALTAGFDQGASDAYPQYAGKVATGKKRVVL